MTNAPGAGGVRLKTLRACSRPDLAESAPRRPAAATMFYLRRDNFGFAAPQGSVAIVEVDALPAGDRSLVIARHGEQVYARRLLRSAADSRGANS
jgi:hypothetical protein